MALHPRFEALASQSSAVPPAGTVPVKELRATVRSYSVRKRPYPVPLAQVEDHTLPGPGGPLDVRIYTPEGTGPFPLIVYFHGGGWVVGDLDTQDMIARALAHAAGAVLVSVDYRLAPEHPFPAAPEDAWYAVRWAAENAAQLQADPARLALAGDSAGAVLAAGVALRARDAGGPRIAAQILYYGSCNYPSADTESAIAYADGPILRRSDTEYYWHQYLTDPEREQHDPLASPQRAASHRGLPPAFVGTAEADPSRDDAEIYGRTLSEAGVPTVIKRYPGMVHGFVSWIGAIEGAQEAIDDAAAFLARHLQPAHTAIPGELR